MTTAVVLNVKQQRFVEEFLLDLNATQAAIRAGYSVKTAKEQAYRLFTNVHIQTAIQGAVEERSQRTQVDQDWVIHRLKDVVEQAMAPVVVLHRKGDPTGFFTFDGSTANKALELLGKHLGMFVDRQEVAFKGQLITQVEIIMPPDKS